MTSSKRFRMRRARSRYWAVATVLAMIFSPTGVPFFAPQAPLQAQALVPASVTGVGNGFVLDEEDLRFIFHQIAVAQQHVVTTSVSHPCDTLLGPGPNQVNGIGNPNGNPQLPVGLRTVDGSCNNLVPVPDQHKFGASDRLFPRLLTPVFRDAEQGTSYKQKLLNNTVIDSQPRIVTNLIADQSDANPAAVSVATPPSGSGGSHFSHPHPRPPASDPLCTIRSTASSAALHPNSTPSLSRRR